MFTNPRSKICGVLKVSRFVVAFFFEYESGSLEKFEDQFRAFKDCIHNFNFSFDLGYFGKTALIMRELQKYTQEIRHFFDFFLFYKKCPRNPIFVWFLKKFCFAVVWYFPLLKSNFSVLKFLVYGLPPKSKTQTRLISCCKSTFLFDPNT